MEIKKIIAAGIIPIHPQSGKILMIRRGMKQSHPNTWSFFGGKFDEEDKNPKDTAKREFKEESDFSGKYYISTKPIYVNNSNHLRFYNFVGIFIEQFVPDLEKGDEAIDYGWFSFEGLPHNMHPGAEELFENKITLIKKLIDYYK